MDQAALKRLGLVSRTVRLLGMGAFLQLMRDHLDSVLLNAEKFPLKVHVDDDIISGYFRHRTFLHHLSSGDYAPFETELFKKCIRPGMIVVDGGAHVGFYTLLAARLVGPTGRVFAFEPDPYNVRCLKFNVQQNNCRNVTVIHKAITDKVGNAVLYQSSGTTGSSLGNRKEYRSVFKGISVKEVAVESTTLDAELRDTPVDVIKFNIEGAEPLALEGMVKIAEQNRPLRLFAEFYPSALYSLGTSPEAMIGLLKRFDFDIYFIDESSRQLVPLKRETPERKGILYCERVH